MRLVRAGAQDCDRLWKMQIAAFRDLLEKYQDYGTSPGNESRERIAAKLAQPQTYFYLLCCGEDTVGAIRVVDAGDGSRKRIAPVFILPEFRNRGLAQQAFAAVEQIHGAHHWMLDTILQEKGNCQLYEKLGYRRTGKTEAINEKMDIVYYEKN